MPEMQHTMPGIPQWLLAVSAGAVLVMTFVLFEWLQRRQASAPGAVSYATWDLLQYGWVKKMVRWRPFQFAVRLPVVLLFILSYSVVQEIAKFYGSDYQLGGHDWMPIGALLFWLTTTTSLALLFAWKKGADDTDGAQNKEGGDHA